MEKRIPAAVCINDLSGVGRASLTVAIPVLSVMGVQCCPLPTAILSAQTGYDHYSFMDFTAYMGDYFKGWQKEHILFDALYSGFLGSAEQIDIVRHIASQMPENAFILVDPVMADNGRVYATYTAQMCRKMRHLVAIADIVTPNITESCLLTDTPYTGEELTPEEARRLCEGVAALGPKTVVMTGVRVNAQTIACCVYTEGGFTMIEKPLAMGRYPGTGDLFASVLCAGLLRGKALEAAVNLAAGFVAHTISYTAQVGTDPKHGVLFEHCLKELIDL